MVRLRQVSVNLDLFPELPHVLARDSGVKRFELKTGTATQMTRAARLGYQAYLRTP